MSGSNVYRYKTKPYQHQVRALKFLLKNKWGGALLLEPRCGKTKTTIDWMSVLATQGKANQALVICPNRVIGTWVNELHLHSPLRVHVTIWDAEERLRWIAGGVPRKPPGYDLYVVVTNFEAFGVPGRATKSGRKSKANGRFKHRALLYKWFGGKPAIGVVDESHKIKSPSGKAANMIVSMSKAFEYRAILTGTPQTKAKRAQDVWMQWQFLNPSRFKEWPTAKDFREHFGRWISDNGYPQYIGPKNMEQLRRRMAEDSFIIRRDQCFDLPPREDLVEYIELNAQTARVYREMAEKMIAEIEDGKYAEAPIKLVQNLRLQQITSGFIVDEDGNKRVLGMDKANRLEEDLEDLCIDKEQKVVIAARWKDDLDIAAHLADSFKLKHWSIRGGVKRADSDEAIRRFRDLEGPGVMILQPAAASLGIDLSTASTMIWYSHTTSWVDFTQTCDRIALSRTSTTFKHYVVKKSVDEMILATLAADGDMGRALMTNPRELINGHPLDLNDQGQIVGLGTFQPKRKAR